MTVASSRVFTDILKDMYNKLKEVQNKRSRVCVVFFTTEKVKFWRKRIQHITGGYVTSGFMVISLAIF